MESSTTEESGSTGRIIATPNILWEINKSLLGKDVTKEFYFFRILWKFQLINLNSGLRHANEYNIAVNMTILKAPVNYPKLTFSIKSGWLTEYNAHNFKQNVSHVSLADLITNKESIDIWKMKVSALNHFGGVSSNELYFFCSIELKDQMENFTELSEDLISTSCEDSLTGDLKSLLDTSTMTDVILKCGDKIIPAHKCILSCRSPVFKAMFQSGFKESVQGVVDIMDVEPTVLQKLVDYVYTGKMDTTDECVESMCNIFKAADKYSIEPLKERCVYYLKENLDLHNVCNVLHMSHLYGHLSLKEYVVSYIANRREILFSEEWKTFAKENLVVAQDVFFYYVCISKLI